MEDENKTTENKITVKEAKKLCLSAFTTGFLLAVLITMLAFLAPDLYTRFVKHKIPPRAKMTMIYNIMKKYYIDDIDKDDMYEGMYTGMAAMPTDVYSYYMSAEEARKYNERTDGNYVGIGVQIQGDTKTKELEIVDVYKSSPAYEAGIKEGDILKSVSGVAVGAENMDEAVEMVRGPENTSVDMVIYRPDEDRDIDVTCFRKQVDMTTVYGRMLDGKTGYIQITGFEGVTPEQFSNVLDELTKEGMVKLVVDVRNNPGGLLYSISAVADNLLPKGTLTYTEDKYGKRDYVYTDDTYMDIPMVVLCNEYSASAAELFTGAVKDMGRGKIIGKTTYGKGIVQTPFTLADGSIVKLTTSKYYTPSGVCIQGVGIEPDYDVDQAEDYEMPDLDEDEAMPDVINDLQLKKALEVLNDETAK